MALISMKQTLVVLIVSMEIRGSMAALRFSSGLQKKDEEKTWSSGSDTEFNKDLFYGPVKGIGPNSLVSKN